MHLDYILSILAYFQRTCFRVAFGGLCSPLGENWDATQNSLLYSQWSQFLYALKKWSQLLSSAELKIRIVEEFIAPTVCANLITVMPTVMAPITKMEVAHTMEHWNTWKIPLQSVFLPNFEWVKMKWWCFLWYFSRSSGGMFGQRSRPQRNF